MKRSGRSATRSTMSGRSTRSALSTSISRRPRSANSFRQALISELLPVPRAPVSSTLLAPKPSTNCCVLRSSRSFCGSTSTSEASRIGATCRTGSITPEPPRLAVAEGNRRGPIRGRLAACGKHRLEAAQQRLGALPISCINGSVGVDMRGAKRRRSARVEIQGRRQCSGAMFRSARPWPAARTRDRARPRTRVRPGACGSPACR